MINVTWLVEKDLTASHKTSRINTCQGYIILEVVRPYCNSILLKLAATC